MKFGFLATLARFPGGLNRWGQSEENDVLPVEVLLARGIFAPSRRIDPGHPPPRRLLHPACPVQTTQPEPGS